MRGSAVLLALAFALAVVPPAGAKSLGSYRLCGADTCTEVPSGPESTVVLDSNAAQPAPPPGPYYEVDFREERAPTYRLIPSNELVGAPIGRNGEMSWYSIHGSSTLVRLSAAAATLEPISPGQSGGRDRALPILLVALLAAAAAGMLVMKRGPVTKVALPFLLAFGALLARRIRIRKSQTA